MNGIYLSLAFVGVAALCISLSALGCLFRERKCYGEKLSFWENLIFVLKEYTSNKMLKWYLWLAVGCFALGISINAVHDAAISHW